MVVRQIKNAGSRWLSRTLARTGLRVSAYTDLSLETALQRLTAHPIAFNTVIDVGASDGSWTERLLRFYPTQSYLLIEANPVHEPGLQAFTAQHPNIAYALAAAGAEEGMLYFDAREPLGGEASTEQHEGWLNLPATTIDAEIQRRALPGPYLIKFDTHGYEIPILDGASETLAQTSLIVMEMYNFRISDTSLTFWEMCSELERRGFRPIDLIAPMFRPHDRALWQFDLFFARADWPGFATSRYD